MASRDQGALTRGIPTIESMVGGLVKLSAAHLRGGGVIVAFLDVDGCLTQKRDDPSVDFGRDPLDVIVRPAALRAIGELQRLPDVHVMAVSGRTYDDLSILLASAGRDIELHAGYGAVQRVGGVVSKHPKLLDQYVMRKLDSAQSIFRDAVTLVARREGLHAGTAVVAVTSSKAEGGAMVWGEPKDAGVAYHYTDLHGVVDPNSRRLLVSAAAIAGEKIRDLGVEIELHNGNVEVGLPFNKLTSLREKLEDPRVMVIEIGDDAGDVKAFQHLARTGRGVAIAVRQPAVDGRPGSPSGLFWLPTDEPFSTDKPSVHHEPSAEVPAARGMQVASAWADGAESASNGLEAFARELNVELRSRPVVPRLEWPDGTLS